MRIVVPQASLRIWTEVSWGSAVPPHQDAYPQHQSRPPRRPPRSSFRWEIAVVVLRMRESKAERFETSHLHQKNHSDLHSDLAQKTCGRTSCHDCGAVSIRCERKVT